ncbi:MAG: hypothetical protein Q9219_002083 [cf. Caloplaca sp. 3 TL-2023]
MNSNVNGSHDEARPRRQPRLKLRQATLILPKTGKRVKRTVTLTNSPCFQDPDLNGTSDEHAPLLGFRKIRQKPSDAPQLLLEALRWRLQSVWTFARSRTGKGVIKCSIAYFIGSLATFVPALAAMLGQQDGKHMVATITVYFHPARSQGSMFEATILAILAFAYATFIGFASMGVSILFGRTLDLVVLGHAIVLLVFCGGGLGFVGWIKQRLGHPLVNISCSLTSLAIITVLTKEGAVQAGRFSDDKIVQVLKMIVMGVIATTAVSFLIYPVSARADLRDNMISFTDSLSEILTMITQSFLTGVEDELQRPQYRDAMEKYKNLLASMETNLTEAKYEHYIAGTERHYLLEAKLVECMQRLAQNIGGLRSAATTQFLILAQKRLGSPFSVPSSDTESPLSLPVIDELPENGEIIARPGSVDGSNGSILTPGDVFAEFIQHLGPSIKSLTYTLREILDDLPYGPGPGYEVTVNAKYTSSLQDAIALYSQSRENAVTKIYDVEDVNKKRSVDVEADFEEIAASCGVFSYALQDFATEMKNYLDVLDEIKLEVEERPEASADPNDYEADIPSHGLSASQHPIKAKHAEKHGQKVKFRYRLWKALAIFRRDDTKFAIKVGAGAALYALPSFVRSTRPIYQHFRGEWGLLSYMLVCSMTIGASNTTGYARFLGTCLGAVCAIVAWEISGGNPFILAACGWIMSFWTAYIIVAQGKGPMGRFIMLTYNLSALYAYSLSVKDVNDDDDEGGISPIISEIAFHRVVAVLSGCLWGLIVTRLVWPISARQKLKDGLSVLWLRMGLIWKRAPLDNRLRGGTASAYMDSAEEAHLHRSLAQLEKLKDAAASEVNLQAPFPKASYNRLLSTTGGMLDALHAINVMILKERRMSSGEALILESTTVERAELRLRINHLFQGTILKLHEVHAALTSVVMASSIKLEYPLNDALPRIEHTRDRLLAKIFGFRKGDRATVIASDKDFAILYTYGELSPAPYCALEPTNSVSPALVTGQLEKAINEMGSELESLFGVLDEDVLKLQ